ncbi:uncharacterized protein LOC126895104 [Daktulosphaira vitifoliae]|uniref:uncharacterized protein LOC126895104 n=1 Tax=Daktulosphaira vitifoliae TaxID=58002 RepID=UPI0021AABDAD|nr:uncharacterized protein LOC126895104 [Daktulosphaira vitifoliae]
MCQNCLYDMIGHNKLFCPLCKTPALKTYLKQNVFYDTQVKNRKKIMKEIFLKYLYYLNKFDYSMQFDRSVTTEEEKTKLMCHHFNRYDVRCKIIAMIRSTDYSVKTYRFYPICIKNQCIIRPQNYDSFYPTITEAIGNGPLVFQQLEDKSYKTFVKNKDGYEVMIDWIPEID